MKRKVIVIETSHTDTSQNKQKEKKINEDNLKKITSERKTTISLLRNHYWKRVKVYPEKIKQIVKIYFNNNIAEINGPIYVGVILIWLIASVTVKTKEIENPDGKIDWKQK